MIHDPSWSGEHQVSTSVERPCPCEIWGEWNPVVIRPGGTVRHDPACHHRYLTFPSGKVCHCEESGGLDIRQVPCSQGDAHPGVL